MTKGFPRDRSLRGSPRVAMKETEHSQHFPFQQALLTTLHASAIPAEQKNKETTPDASVDRWLPRGLLFKNCSQQHPGGTAPAQPAKNITQRILGDGTSTADKEYRAPTLRHVKLKILSNGFTARFQRPCQIPRWHDSAAANYALPIPWAKVCLRPARLVLRSVPCRLHLLA